MSQSNQDFSNPDSGAILSSVHPIATETNEFKESIRRNEERFKYAIEATRDGIWDWDIATGNVFFSPRWARLLGYEPEEVPQRVEFFFSILHPEDHERVRVQLESHFEGRVPVKQDEVRLRTKSGEYRWFLDRGEVVERDVVGKPVRMVGTITDITLRRQAADSLKESQARTRLLIEAANLGLWDWNVVTNEVYFSPEWKSQLGHEDHEIANHFDEFKLRLHPDDLARVMTTVERFFEGQLPTYDIEFRLRHRDGSWRWIYARADAQRDEHGHPIRMMGCHLDITDRKEAERVSSQSLSLMRATLESTADGILVVNSERNFEIFNRVFLEMWRVPNELIENGIDNVALQYAISQLREPEKFLEKVSYLYLHPNETSFDTLHLKDGRVFERYSCPQMIDGQVVGRVWSFRDVTERMMAEAAQAETLGLLQKIASRVPGAVYQYRLHPDGSCSMPYASPGMKDLFQIDPEVLRENADVTSKLVDSKSFTESVLKSARDLTPWIHEMQVKHADGSVRWVAGSSVPEREPDGSTIWHGFIMDVTERKLADAKLRESETRLREAQAISQIGNFHWDARSQQVNWSDELYRIYERDANKFVPTFDTYVASIHPEDRQRVVQELQSTMERKSEFDHHYRILLENEKIRWLRAKGIALVDAEGNLLGLEGTCQDISEQKLSEAATASLEAQLRESQKMEAIGTLAGGIAHDFNNILASIIGNVEIAIMESRGSNSIVQRSLADIQKAGDRARDLVKQILSFSRKQPTLRKPILLPSVIEEVANLLRATLPARLTLDIQTAYETPWVLADSTQIEQILLNLATNAMQAMDGQRGCIRIHLDSVQLDDSMTAANSGLRLVQSRSAGDVVRLVVRDNGPGMSPETLSRIFEPFFTTKPNDQGTGLGLAVVHGIVEGHEGTVIVESQLGQGTTFTIYLPSVPSPDPIQLLEAESPNLPMPLENTETHHLLYLDDDQAVLTITKELLELRGYRVSGFTSYQDALMAIQKDPSSFDLVVTDYNMPGMLGLEVAREIRKWRADLPIIITSGYIDTELSSGAIACNIQQLISKPFQLAELDSIIQGILRSN